MSNKRLDKAIRKEKVSRRRFFHRVQQCPCGETIRPGHLQCSTCANQLSFLLKGAKQ